jgi:hypothetical protein
MAPPKPPPGEQYHPAGEGQPAENSRFGDDYPSFAVVQEQIIKAMIEWEKAPRPAYLQPSQGWPPKESDFFCTDEDPYATACIECKQYGPCSSTFHIKSTQSNIPEGFQALQTSLQSPSGTDVRARYSILTTGYAQTSS